MEPRREGTVRGAALLAGVVALGAMLARRLLAAPVAEWGSNGSAWAEHAGRLSWLAALRQNGSAEHPLGPAALLAKMESGFPAGLYLAGAALEPVFGPTAEAVAWAGPLWLIPLAAGVGAVAAALGGKRSLAPAAALAVLLVPSLPAASLRFYFDLPMTALVWASIGILALRPTPAGGVASGLVAGLACAVKWTALPFVLPLWSGLALARRPDGRRGAGGAAFVGACVALAAFVAAYLAAVGPENSLLAMADEARVGPAGGGVGGLFASTLRGLFTLQPEPLARLVFYGVTTVTGVLSPLGALALAAGGAAWWRAGRPAWPLPAAAIAGHAAVLFLLVRPADERFVLTGLPTAVVAAVIGWDRLAPVLRRRFGVSVVATMLLVAADAHLGAPPLGWPSGERQALPGGGPIASQTLALRGLGMASSFQGRGWYRIDDVPPARAALRDATWAWLLACDPTTVRLGIDEPTVHDEGDQQWFGYRAALAEWRGEGVHFGLGGFDCEEEPPRPGTVWLTRASEAGNQRPPPCPEGASWSLLDVVDDPEGGPGVAAWSSTGATRCPAGSAPRR